MDVSKMFKLPALPASAGQKRKFTDVPSPEMLKKYRAAENDASERSMPPPPVPSSNGKGKGRAATVSEEADGEDAQADDLDGGEDDEDGRFFGGGLNLEQQQILDIFDRADPDEDGEGTTLTLPGLRRQLGKFERIVGKNAEQRGKFPDDPSKFIESEADLDTSLKDLLPLTQNPALFYPELVKSGSVSLLCNLLSHENTDIAVDTIDVIRELTDEDVGAEEEELEEGEEAGEGSKVRMAMAEFIDELLNNSLLALLVSNLTRLHEDPTATDPEDDDSQGIHAILAVFENLLSFIPPISETIIQQTDLLPWLMKRVSVKPYDANKQYASEILAILLGGGRDNILALDKGKTGGVEGLLNVLAPYRKKDPGDGEEVEFMENIFDCLCTVLGEPEMKAAFLEAEGVELMIIMMKERLLAQTRAVKVLDFAMQNEEGSANCERFVLMLGLKTFFSAFMGKGEGKRKKLGATSSFEDTEHLLSILVSLFTNLASDTPPRIRLIAKFVEANYEKVDRLLEMREAAEGRLRNVDRDIHQERRVMEANKEEIGDEEEADWYLRRMDAGLSSLQNADYILGWVCMEDDGAMQHARTLLSRKDQSFKDVIAVLEEFARNIGDEPTEGDIAETQEDVPLQKIVIHQLVQFLEGCDA